MNATDTLRFVVVHNRPLSVMMSPQLMACIVMLSYRLCSKVGNNEHIGLVLHMEEELKCPLEGGFQRFRCIHEGSDKGPGADLEFGNGGFLYMHVPQTTPTNVWCSKFMLTSPSAAAFTLWTWMMRF